MACCCVPLCTSEEDHPKCFSVVFHEIPSEPERRELWLRAILREDARKGSQWIPSDGSRVCSLHFQSDDYKENSKWKSLKTDAVPNIFPEPPYYKQRSNEKGRITPRTNENSQEATIKESQPLGMPSKNNLALRRRHNLLPYIRHATGPKTRSTNVMCNQGEPSQRESQEKSNLTEIGAVEKNNQELPQENEELIVPGIESNPSSPTTCYTKEEPEEIVLEDEDTSEEFNPYLQSSMEMIFESEEQNNRDPTVSHADSTVGTREIFSLYEDTRQSLTGLRTRFEEELTKRDKQIEALKKQNEELKLKNKNCRFCHLFPNASPQVISFMENMLAAMKSDKESPVQVALGYGAFGEKDLTAVSNNDSPDLVCQSSAEWNAQSRCEKRMNNDSQDLVCHSSAEWNVQSRCEKRMVPLYPGTDVMITEEAKCLAILHANGNARKLISCILNALFTKEELSGFSAKGQRENKPFPPSVTSALKMFVLTTCKMDNGLNPLGEKEFHKILNARFGVARRDVRKDDGKRYTY